MGDTVKLLILGVAGYVAYRLYFSGGAAGVPQATAAGVRLAGGDPQWDPSTGYAVVPVQPEGFVGGPQAAAANANRAARENPGTPSGAFGETSVLLRAREAARAADAAAAQVAQRLQSVSAVGKPRGQLIAPGSFVF